MKYLIYIICFFICSCSFYKKNKNGAIINPSTRLIFNTEWKCSGNNKKGPVIYFETGFYDDTVMIIINDKLYLTTNKSINRAGRCNVLTLPADGKIGISINGGELNYLNYQNKYCFLFIHKNRYFKVKKSKKSGLLRI